MSGDTEPEPGQQLGNYLIEERLGEGGMGVVCLADDPRHGRKVAVKLVRRDRLAEPDLAERFRRESNNQAYVSHPNILPLLDSGRHGEVSYFVTPYQSSGDLSALLSRRRLTLAEVAHVTRQVADALSAAHRAGIIHRDVKPGNILVAHETDLSVFLADFGLSLRIAEKRLTETGAVHGTFAYMAPEQFTGQPITPATDVYALALTTHEMATGRSRCDGDCAALSAATARLCDVVRRGTAAEPARRYTSASDFAAAVTAAVDVSDTRLVPAAGTPPPGDHPRGPNDSLDIPAVSWPPRRPTPGTPSGTSPDSAPDRAGPAAPTRDAPSTRHRRRPRQTHALLLVAFLLVLTATGTTVALGLAAADRESPADTAQLPPAPTPPTTSGVPSPFATLSAPPTTTPAASSPSTAAQPGATPAQSAPAQPADTTLGSPGGAVPVPVPPAPASSPDAPSPGPTQTAPNPPGSTNLTVCAESVRIRTLPKALDDGAATIDFLYEGDLFRAYAGEDDHWVQGFAYKLGTEGWVERQWLKPSCPS